jgi:DNA polymerase III gamma/tau subunit
MGLYQEVRPDNFDEVVGNTSTIKALKSFLVPGRAKTRKKKVILLFGPSGCGKTTLARIAAKTLGATEDSIFELNAANTRGIDDVREIARTAGLSTLGGAHKAYIIDESHQLTTAAQEAFLKVLEDGPEGVTFILCTTEPNNLIKTIRTRCTDFQVVKLKPIEILEVLRSAVKKAELEISDEIIQAVAYTNEGSARSALVSLEKVAGIEDFNEAVKLVQQGTEQDVDIFELCKAMNCDPAIRAQRWSTNILLFDRIEAEPEMVRKSILGYLRKEMIQCSSGDVALDLAWLISLFSNNCFYGGEAQLFSLVCRATFQRNPYKLPAFP